MSGAVKRPYRVRCLRCLLATRNEPAEPEPGEITREVGEITKSPPLGGAKVKYEVSKIGEGEKFFRKEEFLPDLPESLGNFTLLF